MNKQRRSDIQAGIDAANEALGALGEILSEPEFCVQIWDELRGHADNALATFQTACDEEQEYYDNMPENMQGGMKGDAAQEAIDQLNNAIGAMEYALDNLPAGSGDAPGEVTDAHRARLEDAVAELENAIEAAEQATV